MVDLGMYVLKLLAVVGGFAVGGLSSGWLLRLLVKVSVQRSVPRPIVIPVQLLGGTALGLATWMLAFGGGSGSGSGGVVGLHGRTGADNGAADSGAYTTASAPRDPRAKIPDLSPDTTVRIEMLGGPRVRNERFYLLEGEREPKNLVEVTKAVLDRRQPDSRPPVRALEILVYEDSVARNHSAVRNLEKWAEQHGLTVILPPTEGNAPAVNGQP